MKDKKLVSEVQPNIQLVCVLASPRPRGNSTALAERICSRLEKRGAAIRRFQLNDMVYRGCQACMACKRGSDQCVLTDDLTEVLEAIREADVLVLATPTYFGEVSGQCKMLLDRTFSFLTPDYLTNPAPTRLPPNKRLVFIQTQGSPDRERFSDIFPRYERFFRMQGFRPIRLIRACGVREAGAVASRSDLLRETDQIADECAG